MLIDTHCHLNFDVIKPQINEIIKKSKSLGVNKFINIGAGFQSSKESIELAKKHQEIFATIGIHPCSWAEWNDEVYEHFDQELKSNPKIVAVGEIGLDFFRDQTNLENQKKVFAAQILLAKKHQKPFIIHCRNQKGVTWPNPQSASYQIWKIIQKHNYENCLFHCYSENIEFAKLLWDKNIPISFNGCLTYPQNEELQEIAKQVSSNLYVLETDCPFLPPQSKRGQTNDPSTVAEVAEFLAKIRHTTLETIATESTANANKFFNFQQ